MPNSSFQVFFRPPSGLNDFLTDFAVEVNLDVETISEKYLNFNVKYQHFQYFKEKKELFTAFCKCKKQKQIII